MTIQDDIREQFSFFDIDLQQRAEDRIANQYKNSPKFIATIKAYQEQIEHLRDAAFELFTGLFSIDHAVGENLDNLGEFVGVKRLTEQGVGPISDEEYRLHIKAKAFINRTYSTLAEIKDTIEFVLDRTDVTVTELDGNIELFFDTPLSSIQRKLFTLEWTDKIGQRRYFFPNTLGVGSSFAAGYVFGFTDSLIPERRGFGVGRLSITILE